MLCLVWAVVATLTIRPVFGPMALVVTAQGEVWIDVDGELWRASADGRLMDRRRWDALGLPGAPANLLRHPGGDLVATVRRDSTLYRLDPRTAQVTGRLLPQWPAELRQHSGRAINLAFHPDGRFAVATGGGDAVALFDAQGGFLARTPPGSYRFTNGLWWAGDALWTTDTNRTQIKRLNGHNLTLQQTLDLPPRGSTRFLGPARARSPWPASPDATPIVGLIRFENDMDRGTATLLTASGQESALSQAADLLPRDLDWLGAHLLLSDGASFSIHRWSPAGQALPLFGDAALQAALRTGMEWRGRRETQRHLAFGATALCWALAGILLWWGRRQAPVAARTLDLSELATPIPPLPQRVRLTVRLHWPLALALVPAGLLKLHAGLVGTLDPHALRILFFVACGLGALALIRLPACLRHYKRLAAEPEFEPVINAAALRRLHQDRRLPSVLLEGERVQETWFMQTARRRWMVLTDQRLLERAPGWRVHRLLLAVPRADITATSTLPGGLTMRERFDAMRSAARKSKGWWARAHAHMAWLEITLRNGQVLAGAVHSTPLARRVAQRLAPRHAA